MSIEETKFNPNGQYRNCCFTLNNYTDDDVSAIKTWTCKYLVFGFEKGEQNTPHLQGYVEWSAPKKGTTLQNILDKRIHWEPRISTAERASLYCKKGEQAKAEWDELHENGPNYGKNAAIFEAGEISNPGKRTDLKAVAKMVLDKTPIKDIAAEHPVQYILYHKGIKALQISQFTHRTTKPTVTWRWGLAGVGKTRKPTEDHKSFYIKDGTMWWDLYEQQEAIIIDDFDGKWPFRDFLRLLDYYPYSGQYKGGYVPINSPFVYITCEHPPEYFWGPGALSRIGTSECSGSANELAQVKRRIDVVQKIG